MSQPARATTRLALVLAVVALTLAACAPAATPAPATPAPATTAPTAAPDASAGPGGLELAGTSWLLIGYTSPTNGAVFTVPMSVTPTLVFGDGTLTGNAGCNTFGGNWTLEGDELDITGPVESTGIACPEPGATIEKAYLTNLGLVNRVELRGENLFMYKADALPELEFIPAGT